MTSKALSYNSLIALSLCLIITICCGCRTTAKNVSNIDSRYLTIEQLLAYCDNSGYCNGLLCCEGRIVRVRGYLDYMNIVHKNISFNATRSKFRLIDGLNIRQSANPWDAYTYSIEVYPVSGDIDTLFAKLVSYRRLPLPMVYLTGTIRGKDAYTDKGRRRLIELEVRAEDVFVASVAKE